MNKLEAWIAWHESVGIGMDGTEHSLEKSSHGKAFSYAWDAAVKAEREKVAAWMRSKSYATGHGDTIEDLLKELEWQVAEREREACAEVAESYEPRCDVCPKGVANAIRARGEQRNRMHNVSVHNTFSKQMRRVRHES